MGPDRRANFSKAQEDNLAKIFTMFDKNSDGEISIEELYQVLMMAGKHRSKEKVEVMMKRVDRDGNGTVGYQEFINMMWDHMNSRLTEKEIDKAFEVMDTDLSGAISMQELQKAAKKTDIEVSDEQVEAIFKETDYNGDGNIDFEEFKKVLSA